MSIQWFRVSEIIWEGLDLRFTRFYFGIIEMNHPSGARRYSLGICSPDYEDTCITVGYFDGFDDAQQTAERLSNALHETALPE